MLTDKIKITSNHIKTLFTEKYFDQTKHMVAFEVANGTGGSASRRADAISMEFWPSNGCEIVGYEFKVSRSDWLNELKQPEKSQAISQYCDRWYLVAPKGVLGIDELPSTWGYMQVSETRLIKKITAPKKNPIALDKLFMASLLRKNIEKYSDEKLLISKISMARKEIKEREESRNKNIIARLENQLRDKQKIITDFKNITGLTLDNWKKDRVMAAIAFYQKKINVDNEIIRLKSEIELRQALNSSALETIDALKELQC